MVVITGVVQAQCGGWFFTFRSAHLDSRCPGPLLTSMAAGADFEGGRVYWYDPAGSFGERVIYVIYNDNTYESYRDYYSPGDSIGTYNPPAERYAPTGPIGWLWANNGPVRDKLGWAYEPVQNFTGRRQVPTGATNQVYIDHGKWDFVLRLDGPTFGTGTWTLVGDYDHAADPVPSTSTVGTVIGSMTPRDNVEVNVRSGPGTSYNILGVVDWRDTLPLLGESGDWYIVDYNGQQGYVSARWVNVTYAPPSPSFHNGVAASLLNDDQFAAMALHENGEAMLVLRDRAGVLWSSPEGDMVSVMLGADGLPETLFVEGYALVFSDYGYDTVDVAVVTPNDSIEFFEDTLVDPTMLSELRSLLAMPNGRAFAKGPLYDDDLMTLIQMGTLALGTAVCVGSFILATSFSGPAGVVLGISCAGALLNVVRHMSRDDSGALQMAGLALSGAACPIAFIFAEPTSGVECLRMVAEAGEAALESVFAQEEQHSTTIEVARGALEYGSGSVQITLTWDNDSDVDLHVVDPAGEEIYYNDKTSASGGRLDVDDRDGRGPENVYWPTGGAPGGVYRVWVHHYAGRTTARYTVLVRLNGQTNTYTGSLAPGASQDVTTFSMP